MDDDPRPHVQSHIRRGEIIDALKDLFAEQESVRRAEHISDRLFSMSGEEEGPANETLAEVEEEQLHSLSNDIMVFFKLHYESTFFDFYSLL